MALSREEQQQINKILQAREKITADLTAKTLELEKAQGKIYSLTEKEAKIRGEAAAGLTKTRQLLLGTHEDRLAAIAAEQKALKDREAAAGQLTEEEGKRLALVSQMVDASEDVLDGLAQQLDKELKLLAITERSAKIAKDKAAAVAGALGISNAGYTSLIGNIISATKESGSFTEALMIQADQLGKHFSEAFSHLTDIIE